VVNQAGKLSPTHKARESAEDEVLTKSLQFPGYKTLLGVEFIK